MTARCLSCSKNWEGERCLEKHESANSIQQALQYVYGLVRLWNKTLNHFKAGFHFKKVFLGVERNRTERKKCMHIDLVYIT